MTGENYPDVQCLHERLGRRDGKEYTSYAVVFKNLSGTNLLYFFPTCKAGSGTGRLGRHSMYLKGGGGKTPLLETWKFAQRSDGGSLTLPLVLRIQTAGSGAEKVAASRREEEKLARSCCFQGSRVETEAARYKKGTL